jgi:hypothetical protein
MEQYLSFTLVGACCPLLLFHPFVDGSFKLCNNGLCTSLDAEAGFNYPIKKTHPPDRDMGSWDLWIRGELHQSVSTAALYYSYRIWLILTKRWGYKPIRDQKLTPLPSSHCPPRVEPSGNTAPNTLLVLSSWSADGDDYDDWRKQGASRNRMAEGENPIAALTDPGTPQPCRQKGTSRRAWGALA